MNKIILIIIVVVLVGIGGYFLLKGEKEEETSTPTTAPTPAPGVAPGEVEEKIVLPEEPTGEVKEFDMIARQWEFSPDTITVNKGDTVILHIKSIDVAHGFSFPSGFGGVDAILEPGKTVDVEFIANEKGTFMFACSISCGSGHTRMIGQLIIK